MAERHVFQLRRGWKDDSTGRNDWAEYEAQAVHIKPLEGELVLEYDNGIPRLKIGDGVREFSALPYMSVDSFILPTPNTIVLYADRWRPVPESEGRFVQDITDQLSGLITAHSKIDLQPTPEQLYIFHTKDVAFTTVNEGGNVRVCAIGVCPTQTYEKIQITITEVVGNG